MYRHVLARAPPPAHLRPAAGWMRLNPAAAAASAAPARGVPCAHYSADKRPSFFGSLLQNLKDEYTKSPEMQQSLQKFREEAKKLEESEALKEARRKFENIEGTAKNSESSTVFKEHISGLADKVKTTMDEVQKTEAMKTATKLGSELGKKAGGAAKTLGSAADNISQTSAFKVASDSAATLRDQIEGQGGRVYHAPAQLRKRKEYERGASEEPVIEANPEATGVELHKDSKFYQSWQTFKENNPVANKFADFRSKYEESDNPMIRGARIVTDKMQDMFSGMFTPTGLSVALDEIIKMDPNFSQEQFLKECERDIIPNVLEAWIRGDLEILQDWCYEAPYNMLAVPIKQAQQMNYRFDSQVLDIEQVDMINGVMMDKGPVVVIDFQAQQIMCVRDRGGKVVEGDPDKVCRVRYHWALCRDMTEVDPRAAWRVLELSMHIM